MNPSNLLAFVSFLLVSIRGLITTNGVHDFFLVLWFTTPNQLGKNTLPTIGCPNGHFSICVIIVYCTGVKYLVGDLSNCRHSRCSTLFSWSLAFVAFFLLLISLEMKCCTLSTQCLLKGSSRILSYPGISIEGDRNRNSMLRHHPF